MCSIVVRIQWGWGYIYIYIYISILLCLAVTRDLQLDIQSVYIKIHKECVHKYTIESSDKTLSTVQR